MRRNRWLFGIGLGTAALFLGGLYLLLAMRLDRGDIYPAYSSLRAGPFGTKALYETYARLPDLKVERLYRPLNQLRDNSAAIFVTAQSVDRLRHSTAPQLQAWEELLRQHGRLILALEPTWPVPPAAPQPVGKALIKAPPLHPVSPLAQRWGIDLKVPVAKKDASPPTEPARATAAYFTSVQPIWRTLYADEIGRVLALERPLAGGTLVLLLDGFLLSNESLIENRPTDLLAALPGEHRHLLFAESQFGLLESGSVAGLARRHGLTGLACGTIALALLWIWRNAVSFLPPITTRAGDYITGRDAAAGFRSLLRRSVAPGELLATCIHEWQSARLARSREEHAAVLRLSHGPNILEQYRAIRVLLHRKGNS